MEFYDLFRYQITALKQQNQFIEPEFDATKLKFKA